MERPELSLPVIWTEDGGPPLAGRIDLYTDRLHVDGGMRDARRTLDIPYGDVASVRLGRDGTERVGGRRTAVLALRAGGSLSFVGFDRPGTLLELVHRLEERI